MMEDPESTPMLAKRFIPLLRMRSRKSFFVLILGTLVFTAILYTSSQLGDICIDGGSCSEWLEVGQSLGEIPRIVKSKIASPSEDMACDFFPDTSNVLLIMKTGASEAYDKIPTQLLTTLRCLDDYLIFSDMEQEIAGRHIRDSLEDVLDEVKMYSADFKLYHRQQLCRTDQETCNKGRDVAREGWALDKYKNIHIAEKSYGLRPSYDWYLFVDADSYVAWPTLMDWLHRFNPLDTHYLGSVAMLGGSPFAHGGSGYLVSQGMMQAMFKGKTGVANGYDQEAEEICCGDALFAQALFDQTKVSVKNVWPTINGEKPHTLAYGENQWCQPIFTMHHVDSEEVSEMAAYERERNFTSPLRIKDVFHRFAEDELDRTRDNWDNMSNSKHYMDTSSPEAEQGHLQNVKKGLISEVERKAHLSFEDCRNVCAHLEDCLQYRYSSKKICSIGKTISHGQPKKPKNDDDERFKSGWDLERIEAWVRDNDHCGDEVLWPKLS